MKTGSTQSPPVGDDDKPERAERMSALMALIAYARDEAAELEIDFLAFCLDASLAAAREEIGRRAVGTSEPAPTVATPLDLVENGPLH